MTGRGVTGRVVLVAVGAVAALIGLALAAVAVVLLAVTGRDGAFGGGASTLSTPRYALVSDAAGLGSGRVDATVRIRVAATGGTPVFVGVAPAAAVEGYLRGVAYDELVDVRLSPLRATLVPADGADAPVRPADRPVWTVSASGPGERTIDVPVRAGGQRLVVMNADASEGVEVTAALSLRAPFLRTLAVGLLVAGGIVAPAGGILLVLGVRRTVRARRE
ncbi:MAG TPA: hypothetical protein VLM05_09820 [Mycobacteriales bacterium]|nr:hypothetical protein [Mycobacteriales bacterium]